jgi:hypothetical protein
MLLCLYLTVVPETDADPTRCYLFPPLRWSTTAHVHQFESTKPVSYPAAFKAFKNLLCKYGFDASRFSLHSMRAGGATDAFNRNVPPQTIDKHGRWKSTYTKYRYFRSDDAEHVKSIALMF